MNFFTLSILGCFPIAVIAQTRDTSRISQLNEITVTASKGPQKAGETGKVVTILSHEYLQQNSGRTIANILNDQAGIIVAGSGQTRGAEQQVYMRGASAGNTLILIDGLPVNDAAKSNGVFDLNFITPDMVEKIEILRGSQSTLYGSDAVAGVINIITRKNDGKKAGIGASASYGSYNDFQGGAHVHGSLRKFSYLLGYKYEKTDGFSEAHDATGTMNFEKDGFKQNNVFAKLGLEASSRLRFQYLFSYGKYHHDLDNGPYTDEKDYANRYSNMLHMFSSEYRFKKGSWHILYSYQRNKQNLLNDSTDIPVYSFAKYNNTDFSSNTHQAESYVNLNLSEKVRFIAGGVYAVSNYQQDDWLLLADAPGIPPIITKLGKDSIHSNQVSAYGSLLLHNMGGFNLEAGGRYNHHNIYGNNGTFSFNPSYLLNQQHKIFINISSAYKIPSLYQLYVPGYGNRELKPETTTSYEAGYQAAVANDRINFRVTGFARNTHNLFYADPANFYKYRNANKQVAAGVEAEAAWNISRTLQLTVNYTYTDGRITQQLPGGKDTTFYNLYYVPKHAMNATLGYQVTPALYASATYKYIGQRYQGTQPMGDYYTLDLYGEYKFGNLLKIFAGFRNITDYQYFDILGYNSRRFNFNTGIVFNL
ncbi:TonB-dependent receptor domain-containing protein [Chitinophaga sp. MM2321]|uniref:TonB-dependent receptor plug domain-containing protein n=1 Tax=Chitinophaga sp. MM2321 TaxID=3137178 RepID=UPI0032D58F27